MLNIQPIAILSAFAGRIVRGVKIGLARLACQPSQRNRQRPINNVADITNYVLTS